MKGKTSHRAWGKIAAAVLALALSASLLGSCSKASVKVEESTPETVSEVASYTLTPDAELESMDIGETAVFDEYEITVVSADVSDGKTVVSLKVKAHDEDQSLAARYLEPETGTRTNTTFPDAKIECSANSEVSGTITFGSDEITQIRWNNWSNEATWKLPAKEVVATSEPTVTEQAEPVAEPEPEVVAPEPQTVTVYITNTGEKYHTSGCRYLKKSKIAIDLDSAKAQGYTPCSVCNPPA